jgi:hypothetical protein
MLRPVSASHSVWNGTKATQFATQFSVIVDFPVEGNCDAPVEGQLRLRRALRIDDTQLTRPHRRVFTKRYGPRLLGSRGNFLCAIYPAQLRPCISTQRHARPGCCHNQTERT